MLAPAVAWPATMANRMETALTVKTIRMDNRTVVPPVWVCLEAKSARWLAVV